MIIEVTCSELNTDTTNRPASRLDAAWPKMCVTTSVATVEPTGTLATSAGVST